MQNRTGFLAAVLAGLSAFCLGCPSPSQNPDSGGGPDSGGAGLDSGGADSGAGLDAGPDGGTTITVTATRILHYVNETGTVQVPVDFSKSTSINVLVPDPNVDGGYDVYPGTGTATGTLSVPNVPAGLTSLYVQYSLFDYVEDLSAPFTAPLDLGEYVIGRPGITRGDGGIQYELNGLTPWGFYDALLTVSPGAGYRQPVPRYASDGGTLIPVGGTTLAVPTPFASSPMIDGTQGDVTVVYQTVPQDGGQGVAQVIGAAAGFQTSGFSMVSGTNSILDAGLQPLTQSTVSATYDNASFGGVQGDVSPNVSALTQYFGVSTTFIQSPIFEAVSYTATSNWTASGSYGNPLPGLGQEYGYATGQFLVPELVLLADGGSPILADGGVRVDDEIVAVSYTDKVANFFAPDGGLLSPFISPPTSVNVDGVSFYNDQTLGSTTPVVSWAPPVVGTPLFYQVQIDHVSYGAAGLRRAVFHVLTSETSLQLFPGLLLPGGTQYVIRIVAVARPNGSFATPYLTNWPNGTAAAISGVLTTP